MDILTLAQLNKLKKSGGAGYVEPGKVYTYDGNAKETIESDGLVYAAIADNAPDLHTVTKAVYTAPDRSKIEFTTEHMTVETNELGQVVYATMQGMTVPAIMRMQGSLVVLSKSEPGAQAEHGYCSRVEFAETTHPIDPKFIPGVCLPVVDISVETLGTIVESQADTRLNENESAQFEYATSTGLPAVIKLPSMSSIAPNVAGSYTLSLDGFTLSFHETTHNENRYWVGVIQT